MSVAEPLQSPRVRETVAGVKAPAGAKAPAASRAAVRKAIFSVHLWVGIALSVWFSLLGLTGSLLVFKHQVDALLNPALTRSRPHAAAAQPLTPDAALASAQAAFPDRTYKRIAFPPDAGGTFELRYGKEKQERDLFVDAYSGAMLGERDRHGSFMEQVLELHKALLLGKNGEQVNGVGAILLVALLATGIYLWWPSNRKQWAQRLTMKRGASPKRLLYDLHNVFGIYTLPVLLVIAVTGAVFIYEKQVEGALYAMTGSRMEPEKAKKPEGEGMKKGMKEAKEPRPAPRLGVSLAGFLSASETAAPGTHLKHIDLPEAEGKPVRVHRERREGFWVNNKMKVHLDPATATLVRLEDERRDPLAKRILRWNGPLHEGRWGGLATQWLYLLIGLIVPLGLGVTGVWKWWQTRQSRNRNRLRHGAA